VSALAAIVIAYLLGSIPFAYLAGRARGIDLRTVGSGNLGAANVFRTLGRGTGIAVMAADIGKGAAAVLIARALTGAPWPAVAAGAAMAGHIFPVWLRFKGGKGVAVGGGRRPGPPPPEPDASRAWPGAADRPLAGPPGLSPWGGIAKSTGASRPRLTTWRSRWEIRGDRHNLTGPAAVMGAARPL